jgi:hypothetical protein
LTVTSKNKTKIKKPKNKPNQGDEDFYNKGYKTLKKEIE